MILAVDVHYDEDGATVAGVLFGAWQDCEPAQVLVAQVSPVADYVPGQFYKRELPCILALLAQVTPLPDTIVVDGYVYLGQDEKPGLGQYLYDALDGQCAVIGVAKNRFKDTAVSAELLRGTSQRPLFVTAVGISQAQARHHIKEMCGHSRVPTLLKKVDQICRGKI